MTGAETCYQHAPVPHHTHAIGGRDGMADRQFSKFAHPTYSDEQMIAELRRVDALLGTAGVLSGPRYATVATIHRGTVSTRFGSWREALEAAGLRSPTVKGGQARPCDVCGTDYTFRGGSKSARSCSRACALVLQDRYWARLRKDAPTKQASRGRARLLLQRHLGVLVCATCGVDEVGTKRIEVHHKDRNWRNNDLSNLVALCALCHGAEHRSLVPRLCAVCGVSFRPRRDGQATCGRSCGGKKGAALRMAS